MRSKTSALLAIAALVVGISFFAAPSVGYAGTISCIEVDNGGLGHFGGDFGNTGACPDRTTWTNAGAVVIPEGGTLVLTQNQAGATGLAGYNFDTSDQGTGAGAQYTVRITTPDGVFIALDTSNVLAFGGHDDNAVGTNEAANWVPLLLGFACGGGHICDAYVGYADTLHSGACADGGDCLPSGGANFGGVFANATIFKGSGSTLLAGFTGQPGCTVAGGCYDAGAILIFERRVTVPEPSSLFLLGVGLMGVAAYGRRHLRKNS